MNKVNFHYIAVLLDMLYQLEISDSELEELGLVGWDLIGNKPTRLYRYSACLDSNNSIKIPCNAESIESVTAQWEDWSYSTNKQVHGDQRTSYIEQKIEAEKVYTSPYYIPGKLLKYEQVGDTLYFAKNYGKVTILYKGILMDEDGLPELSDKEALAIATFIAYTLKFKEGLQTNNPQIIAMSDRLNQLWLKRCDQARVSKLSQNDMNEILDIKNSWERACYGMSYKYRK